MKTQKLHLVYSPTQFGEREYKVAKTINMIEPRPGELLTEREVRQYNQKNHVVVTITEAN